MLFTELSIRGAFQLELERREDERGFFARTWCRDEFARHGLRTDLAQCSVSFNKQRGTLRGMHYQAAPRTEAKVVSCVRGAIYDVVLDLRPDSVTFKRWEARELTGDSLRALYIPEGCAHGFQTLTEDALVFYQIAEAYSAEHARGVRWDDPQFGIAWPDGPRIMAKRDAEWADFAL